ncbi:uncharacterized protein LOC114534781 [Dendronephthya gigantea]|uniref:uncharacterized protein LOC114534781 n=1 Tax=Dendronephthya gigantea TaxID=151771 RepID=UPI00106A208B|nr:uncharacterized protein LOC114534781 [Dendronephthya gigantea]
MARNDLNHLILRPGELHIVMAQLRTLGSFIEHSGIDLCWSESDLYGPATVKQILAGKHVKRGETAHLVTLQVLFMLYQKAFLSSQDEELVKKIDKCAKQLGKACEQGKNSEVKEAEDQMVEVMKSEDLVGKMERFEEGKNPEFKVFRSYMKMIMEMLLFVRAVRTADWQLHLRSLQLFTKYFFAHDKLNYARMIPIYLAEMENLPESAPEIYKEFAEGNWVVNKNRHIPFCGLGADHALEHINRSMKVSGGLVGITLNPSARTKFFMIAPELARLAEEAKKMAGRAKTRGGAKHHALTAAGLSREEKNITKLLNTIEGFTNPFTEQGDKLFNLVTKVVASEKVKKDLIEQSEIGQKLYDDFVRDRIITGKINLWSSMKKRKLQTWKAMTKKIKISTSAETIELQEDRNLFARMLIICKSRPEIDIQEAVGTYEFRVVPRSMFTADGTMLHCTAKSALMPILENLPIPPDCSTDGHAERQRMKVSIVDAMAEVQALDKPEWIRDCSQLAQHFAGRIFENDHEEADTKIILHAQDATVNGATEIQIHSPDTDVFVLSLRRYTDLCQNTVFVTGKGQHHRVIKLKPIVDALGPLKTAALPAFHALTGADNTGSFARKGKPTCWRIFDESDDNVLSALARLGTSNLPSDEIITSIAKFVCQLFVPKTEIDSLKALRWWLFTKKQATSQQLPPTDAALHQAVLRAHYQLIVWNNDTVPNPTLPSPENYGWKWDEGNKIWCPVMTTLPPAPRAIIHLVKCKCAKEKCATNRCGCKKVGLKCTDLCGCSASDNCMNKSENDDDNDDEDEDGYMGDSADDDEEDEDEHEDNNYSEYVSAYSDDSDNEVDRNIGEF